MDALISILSRFGCHQLPTPAKLFNLIAEVAKFEFLRKPASAISEIHSSVPKQHLHFWNEQKTSELYSVYKAHQVSSAKVLQLHWYIQPQSDIHGVFVGASEWLADGVDCFCLATMKVKRSLWMSKKYLWSGIFWGPATPYLYSSFTFKWWPNTSNRKLK